MEWTVAIIYTIIVVGTFFFLMEFLHLWLKIVVAILLIISSPWVGRFLRKKKAEAIKAESATGK